MDIEGNFEMNNHRQLPRQQEKTEEDYGRRKRVECSTNILAVFALVDAIISVSLIVLLFKNDLLNRTMALLACIQLACFLLLSVISACILLNSRHRYNRRIDALGAWLLVHFLNIISNIVFMVFELYPDPLELMSKHIFMIVLLIWKLVFVFIEVIGSIYCFYIVQNPIKFVKVKPILRHPLFNECSDGSTTVLTESSITDTVVENNFISSTNNNNVSKRTQRRPISCISYPSSSTTNVETATPSAYLLRNKNVQSRYDSYLSLANNTESRLVRNPCYDSELSLEYANHYSPYDNLIHANHNRLSVNTDNLPKVLPSPGIQHSNQYTDARFLKSI